MQKILLLLNSNLLLVKNKHLQKRKKTKKQTKQQKQQQQQKQKQNKKKTKRKNKQAKIIKNLIHSIPSSKKLRDIYLHYASINTLPESFFFLALTVACRNYSPKHMMTRDICG